MVKSFEIEGLYPYAFANVPKTTDVEKEISAGVSYLECSYTLLYGWLTDVSLQKNMNNSVISIPNIFDTAVIIDVLTEAGIRLNDNLLEGAAKWLLNAKTEHFDTWNFFLPGFDIVPNDPDTSANAICCLYGLQGICKQEAVQLMENLVNMVWMHPELNVPDVYIRKGPWPSHWPIRPRICVSVITNVLYALSRLEMEDVINSSTFEPSFIFISRVVDEWLQGEEKKFLKCYEDLDVGLFFIGRLIRISKKAKEMFGSKFEQMLKTRIGKDTIPFYMSCRILAALNCDLLANNSCKEMILKEARLLLVSRDSVDNSWTSSTFYNAHSRYQFGSKAVSTGFAIAALKTLKKVVPDF